MKAISILVLTFIILIPFNSDVIASNNLEFDFGLSYNYHPYLNNITEDIKGENEYLTDNKFNFLNISATTDSFTKLEYSLGYHGQIKYWLLDVLAIGSELKRINLKSEYRAEADDGYDSYYLQSYNLSSSALLATINLRPFGQQGEELRDKSFWQRLILDFNLGGGVYYHRFVRGYDIDFHHNDYHYVYDSKDTYDGFTPGLKGRVELTYLINERNNLTLGANYNKILAKKLTDDAGEGYRSIYRDDFQEEEFDLSNYGFYFSLVFKL